MSNIETPKELCLDGAKRKLWDDLVESTISPFLKKDYWEVFILAASVGYCHNSREKLKDKQGTIPYRTIEKNSAALALIEAIAISENSIEIILNKKEICNIAEEYANGGIKFIYDLIFGSNAGSAAKLLESEAIAAINGP